MDTIWDIGQSKKVVKESGKNEFSSLKVEWKTHAPTKRLLPKCASKKRSERQNFE